MDSALKVKIARHVRLIAPVMIRRTVSLEFAQGFVGMGSVRWVRTAPLALSIAGHAQVLVVSRMIRRGVIPCW